MIHKLSISGLAIIDSLSIEFSPGFNVITGETGAGKSILIRALNFLTGGKAGNEAVRKGATQALVSGEFLVPKSHPVLARLENFRDPRGKVGSKYPVLLRRQLNAKGRSQAWVNDVAITMQPLKEIGPLLVDIFAQHENQRLMNPAVHMSYLDEFVGVKAAKEKLNPVFTECEKQVESMRSLLAAYYSAQDNRDFVEFRLEELKKFNPTQADYEKTDETCQRASGGERLRDALSGAVQSIEGSTSLSQLVWQAKQSLDKLPEGTEYKLLHELKDRLSQLASEVEDVTFDLRQNLSKYDFDEEGLEKSQERLYGYQKLFRKHNISDIEGLLQVRADLENAFGSLEETAIRLEDNLNELETHTLKLEKLAHKLTQERKKAAQFIKIGVEKELQQLAMKGAQFDVAFTPVQRELGELELREFDRKLQDKWNTLRTKLAALGSDGGESSEFLLASNPGEPILPLTRIASGGEISRIMLALKKALSVDADTCVLVFDEIDSGISGRVADIVGKKMRELSGNFQVLCISHLPQVSVYADTHFLVEKANKKKRTETSIVRLSEEQSAKEIARLLSGEEVSSPSLANAKALIAKAKKHQPTKRA